jgi:type I restriction enzyme S subunit
MKRGAGGLTFQIVNKTEFSNIETKVPNKEEQILISKLFFKIDNLITLHQRELEKLKNIKKTLFSKMFV